MTDSHDRLEITPQVIEAGQTVIQVAHVTTAGYGTSHPLRPYGLAMIGLGIVLIITEFMRDGLAAFALVQSGSPLLWIAFAAAGVGLFLSVFARRALVIRTVDGARTNVPASDEDAATAIIGRIRGAIEHGTALQAAHQGPRALEAKDQPNSAGATVLLPNAAVDPRQKAAALPQAQSRQPAAGMSQTQPIGAARKAETYTNGRDHGGQLADPFGPPAGLGEADMQQPSQYLPARKPRDTDGAGHSATAPSTGGQGANFDNSTRMRQQRDFDMPATGPTASASPAPKRETPEQDLDALIEHVKRANLQHKQALIDLLRVVDDFYRGQASREDALAHWRSFADYVVQYLSDVDGLMEMTERFGRHMVSA
ncbi:MAG: hypothetical protein ACK5JT_22200 [Hyphomicrobiaceae bacterium]